MPKKSYNVIGVMSGTSLDGIDLARVVFTVSDGNWSFEIFECETVAYDEHWLSQLKIAVGFSKSELEKLNSDYTLLLGEITRDFIDRNKIENLDAVCSHGHTILHQPHKKFTLQIGNLPEISKIAGQKVVCDFRVQDVELGGQGAPLVPIGDRILFPEFDYCLNLGGFSNVSFEDNELRLAFDISPVNTVLNFYADKLGHAYDDKGQIARSGQIDYELLAQLNALDFYEKPYPKSLGFEFVRETILPLIEAFDIPTKDKLRTFIEHVAVQIATALPKKSGKLLATGGGAYNDFLMHKIQEQLPQLKIAIPEKKILEFKEALIFALLGVLKMRDEINVLASVTGSKHDHSSGKTYEN
ncbi:anhydro-N-acetylmuramic acid kinase [Flavobacterium sp.]|uniref:anhydro-N-acetylmuramic acid kinase n=1 Tax=Flavobacterium sp. TaxID=239 RepID=UPI00122394C8|nr:anhydro-N-acetylmuramic acid kinase [Flavobacterium sp.]RZJ70276.1 MAG: anhydro-N-acetylmuramic acid kinase [Flavobacterium sp.]